MSITMLQYSLVMLQLFLLSSCISLIHTYRAHDTRSYEHSNRTPSPTLERVLDRLVVEVSVQTIVCCDNIVGCAIPVAGTYAPTSVKHMYSARPRLAV
jgi:hypothetical protein